MLLWYVPSSESQANYNCCEFHVGRLGANLGFVVEGEKDGAILLPGGVLGDYGDPSIAGAVGGVSLFLEYAEEVVVVILPSTVYVYGVFRWQGYVLWKRFHGLGEQLYGWAVVRVVGRIGWCDGEDALLQMALWVGVCARELALRAMVIRETN